MLLIHEKSEIPISIIITNHGYEPYLDECIISAITQSTSPHEIIIVDDKPKNNKAKEIASQFSSHIQYHQVDFGHPLQSREYGFKKSTSKYVCFLDADDYLDKSYIQGATQAIIQENVDLVYSDLQYFKDGGIGRTLLNRTSFHPSIPRKRISQTNFLHVGCVVNRETILASNAFDHHGYFDNYHEDWAFWRHILRTGCSYSKQPNLYYARKHDSNRSAKLQNVESYFNLRGVHLSTITFVGRTTKVNKCPWYIIVLANDLSYSYNWRSFGMLFGRYIPYDPQKYQAGYYTHKSKLQILNEVSRSSTTDYIFFYDEDNLPETWVVERMLKALDHDVAMVHDANYEPYDCTLVVTDIFKDYYYGSTELPNQFDTNEKIIII